MNVAVAGAGPTGLFTAIALARRGHRVTIVDRDTGPDTGGWWERRGVMQFHHPHGFRPQVVDALMAEMPEVLDALLAAGATRAVLPEPRRDLGLHCRRMTFERVLRAAAIAEPGVTLHTGHVEDVLRDRGRATGLRVDGRPLDADLVVDATGRLGRLGDDLRAPGEGSDCGLGYVSRQYELLPGAEPGPLNSPIGNLYTYQGYFAGIFVQDNRTITALISRTSTDRQLAGLRAVEAYEAAARAIPSIASWTAPGQSRPITPVLPGGRLQNTYRGQLSSGGTVTLPRLVRLGDTVCTTNPTAGRGVATSLQQARTFVALLDGTDVESATLLLDRWCQAHIRPWYDDHLHVDADVVRRWNGGDVDVTRRLPSDLVVAAAAEADTSLMRVAGPYLSMDVLPAALDEIEPRAREIYASGWRPAMPPGPTRDELVELIAPLTGARP